MRLDFLYCICRYLHLLTWSSAELYYRSINLSKKLDFSQYISSNYSRSIAQNFCFNCFFLYNLNYWLLDEQELSFFWKKLKDFVFSAIASLTWDFGKLILKKVLLNSFVYFFEWTQAFNAFLIIVVSCHLKIYLSICFFWKMNY